jgi:hypothetical protein
MNELHEHFTIQTIAQELGIPASSVVVRFSNTGGRRLRDAAVTAFLLTEAVADPQKQAERFKTKLVDFINSGKLYNKLLSYGTFPGLTGIEVSVCCNHGSDSGVASCCEIEGYDASSWEGKAIPSLKQPKKVVYENEMFEEEQEVKEYLPDSFVISVNVVVGVVGLDKRRKSMAYPNGEPVYRGTDFTTTEAQVHLAKLCDFESGLLDENLGKDVLRELHMREVRCFIPDFSNWLVEEGLGTYPIGGKFAGLLKSWIRTSHGSKWKGFFGFDNDEVKWVRIQVVTDVPKESTAPRDILDLMDSYDAVVEYRNEERPEHDLEAWSCSPSFVLAQTEDGIISSALWCAFISLTCALVSIFLFTASAVLAFTVVLTVAMVLTCQAGTMFVGLGWNFGAIEAISLILFVGFSVDYTLHFAEAFHVSPPPKIDNALTRVARAIVAAGMTTAGSAAFLVFCTIQVFKNFGLAVVFNTMWSLLFALVFFPAILGSLPERYHEAAYLPAFEEDDDDRVDEACGRVAGAGAQHSQAQTTELGRPIDVAGPG